ncbi:MAG: MFS transporter [Gammaproteobacteria bacterium]
MTRAIRVHSLPALSESARLRYFAFMALYVAQGLPSGLLTIAVPAWMAERGLGTAEVGAYLAVLVLPWSLKLINGVVTDRFGFLAMGRRRPWVLGAQLGLLTSLVALAAIPDPIAHLYWLTAVGFAVNVFAAFQDVAVDGLAIDVLPTEQQARANGFMWGGKTLGVSGGAAASGTLLDVYGLGFTAIAIGALVSLIMLLPLVLRERPGERLLPWTSGEASAIALQSQLTDWRSIGASLWRAFCLPTSLLIVGAAFLFAVGDGIVHAMLPVLSVQELGWDDAAYAHLLATAGLVAGVVGMIAGGAVVDFLGRVRLMVIANAALVALAVSMGMVPSLWPVRDTLVTYVVTYFMLYVIITIAFLATAMVLCWKRVAATQFALYMAVFNLGNAVGAGVTGPLDALLEYSHLFFVVAACGALMLVLLWWVDLAEHPRRLSALEEMRRVSCQ